MQNEMQIVYKRIDDLREYVNNPRNNENAVAAVAASIDKFGWKQPIVIDAAGVIVCGHTRYKAAQRLGQQVVPCVIADDLTEDEIRAYRLADNKTAELAGWDFDKLDAELEELAATGFDMDAFGFDLDDLQAGDSNDGAEPERAVNNLAADFVVPPFSVFDARQGYWNERKKQWKAMICDKAQARSEAVAYKALQNYDYTAKFETDVSILDPVLAEIIIRYFMPNKAKGGNVVDCFAGDTVFGFVAAQLGNNFTGIELRQEQADFNQSRVDEYGLAAKYICDDGRNVLQHVGEGTQDLLVSCPPYFDLEVYSDLENDASNQATFEEFYAILDEAFTAAAKTLKNDRFAAIVVGDIRNNKTGFYYDFIGSVIRTFEKAGMQLYNSAVLVTPVGTAAIRARQSMRGRKLVKTHQNILVFYKGDPKRIKDNFTDIEIEEEFFDESENV